MTLRTYIRLFRPVPALAFTTIYTGIAALEGGLFHFNPRTSWFLAFAGALPLLLGFALAGAVQEPMHRAFILLLPDATRVLRRVTTLAVFVSALFATAAATLVNPSIPPAATFGLTCVLLAAPCLDRRRHICGMGGMLIALVLWIGFNEFIGAHLLIFMNAWPWIFCIGGLVLAHAALDRGFARPHLRQRAATYFIPMPGALALLFDRVTSARQNQELRLNRLKPSLKPGSNWSVHSVGATTREWMTVFLHGFFGNRGGYLKIFGQLTLYSLIQIAALPVLDRLMGRLTGNAKMVPGYWDTLAKFAGPTAWAAHPSPVALSHVLAPFIQPGLAALIAVFVVRPQLPYPISRDRLARTVFGLSLLQLSVVILVPGTLILFSSLLGQAVSGQFWPDYGVRNIIGVDFLLSVALPLLLCGSSFRHGFSRLLWSVPVGVATAIAVYLRDDWISMVLTIGGVLGTILLSSAMIGLLWLSLRRQYRTNDLLFEASPLGTASA